MISGWASERYKIWKTLDLKLHMTKLAIELYRESKEELKIELWKLAETFAKKEWGEDTILDDFSVEGKILVRNKEREAIL